MTLPIRIDRDLFTKHPVWVFWFEKGWLELDFSVRVWYWEITSNLGSRINLFLFDQLYS